MAGIQGKKGKADSADLIIGETLRDIRLLRGLSQQDLGKQVGVTFQQVQKYEQGINRISAVRLLQFAKALNVEVILLFGSLYDKKTARLPKLNPKILELLALLNGVGDKNLLKQITNIARVISRQ